MNYLPRVPIVLAFTPNYFIPATTTILSILKNSDDTDKFEIICLLTDNLPSEMVQALEIWNPERLKFVFINLEGHLDGIYIDERYTVAASYRLLLPNILPDYESVIYLDCDIIVRNNLAKLYYAIGLHNYYLAAVFEATLDFQRPYLEQIGCKPGEYINSGFLIMNLERMRMDNIVPKLIQKLDNPNSNFPDQDALNIICQGHILFLSPIYNSIRTYFLPQYKEDFLRYYTLSDWDDVQQHGTIHYTGAKPWNSYTIEFDTWWKYYQGLPKVIKKLGPVNAKLLFLAKMFDFYFFKSGLNMVQKTYRKFNR